MTASALLTQLESAGVALEVDGANLRVSAPAGALTAAVRGSIAAVKGELIALLTRPATGTVNSPHRVYGERMMMECWFIDACDGRLIRKLDLYCCGKCQHWFRYMGPKE